MLLILILVNHLTHSKKGDGNVNVMIVHLVLHHNHFVSITDVDETENKVIIFYILYICPSLQSMLIWNTLKTAW